MRIVDKMPCGVRQVENTWIPLSDGTQLAARLWVPECADREPVPCILEYIPYRKRDLEREHDEIAHGWFAGHGYACARVDLRGSGDSQGVLKDEYLQQELDDGVEVLQWLAAQPWCNGRIGMYGISWGGFNGLQIAAMQPPELKAVITACSTEDRYADDVHYMGGCLLLDNLAWAAVMHAHNSLPPDPEIVGDHWRDMWLERLNNSGFWLDTWTRHQLRDDFWKHGSVCEDFDAIQCPVFAVSGWADGYSNAVFRLMSGLKVPRRGLIGPWVHAWPHIATPGPAIGFLQECKLFWNKHLKEDDNGWERDPMLRVWMQDMAPPAARYASRPGRWVAEDNWPHPRVRQHSYRLAPHRLADAHKEVVRNELRIRSPLGVGRYAGKWCSYDTTPDLPARQRFEDGGALLFDSAPLDGPLEILGAPVLDIEVAADRPVAQIAARLSDVAPDGSVTRVTYGLLNLTHRAGHDRAAALEPGRFYRVRVQLNDVAQRFEKGHRVRLALSSSYWPLAWPPPAPVMLKVRTHSSSLHLPHRPNRPADACLRPFEAPEGAPPAPITVIRPSKGNRWVTHDLGNDTHTLEVLSDRGVKRYNDIDLTVAMKAQEWYTHCGDDHLSVKGETLYDVTFQRRDWTVHTVTRQVITCTADTFRVRGWVDAWENEEHVHSQSRDREIPRNGV